MFCRKVVVTCHNFWLDKNAVVAYYSALLFSLMPVPISTRFCSHFFPLSLFDLNINYVYNFSMYFASKKEKKHYMRGKKWASILITYMYNVALLVSCVPATRLWFGRCKMSGKISFLSLPFRWWFQVLFTFY